MNCTQQDLQIEQTGDIIQILFMAFTVIPLIASEILPFIERIKPNGIIHAIVLALSNMKYRERPRATNVAHSNP
jgi:hypothetical protein